ncbi:MAG: DUF47 family protein [Candidatus Jordarchaeales archaeon]|nr:DUF47 family protein [Candidatus Jordarchaeia archaeon]
MPDLAGWFRIRREEKSIHLIDEHSRKVFSCVMELVNLVDLVMNEGSPEEVFIVARRINEMEHEADIMRRNVLDVLSEGKLDPSEREDLVHLTKRLDAIANNANAAARRISILNLNYVRMLGEPFTKMVSDAKKCVEKLMETIDALKDGHDVSFLIDEVERAEFEVDQDHLALRKALQDWKHGDVPPFTAITLSNLIDFVEGIADSAEDTADFIRLVSIKKPQKHK